MTFGIIVGTRPNFVKASAVVRALRKHGQKPVLIHTGQHHDAQLSDVFFKRLDLPKPDHHLGVASASRGKQLGEITTKLSQLLPELGLSELIVVGDVTSTVAGALAADACDLPVSHVEAGLRSFDLTMPEERNRMLVDAIAHRLFASEPSGVENLLREGHASSTIHHVGNVMIDTLLRFRDEAIAGEAWKAHGLERGKYAVATLHRPGNVDSRESLVESLALLEEIGRHWPVLFAAHPRTQARLKSFNLTLPAGVKLQPPIEYLEFIGLMTGAALVLTDSGGAQEETAVLRVPCLTARENTERPITLTQGSSRLVGRFLIKVREALSALEAGTYALGTSIPLWDGSAGDRIADILVAKGPA